MIDHKILFTLVHLVALHHYVIYLLIRRFIPFLIFFSVTYVNFLTNLDFAAELLHFFSKIFDLLRKEFLRIIRPTLSIVWDFLLLFLVFAPWAANWLANVDNSTGLSRDLAHH